jgi:putative membrane protein
MAIRSWNAVHRTILLVAMLLFLVRLLLNGQITFYIHPRFIWLTWVTCFGLGLMLVGQIRQLGVGGEGRVQEGLFLAFAVLLAVGFAFPPHTFGVDLASKQGLNVTVRSGGAHSKSEPPPPAQMLEVDTIIFVPFLQKIYEDPTPFVGKRIAITGFTYYPPNAKSDEFAVVRLVVTCHVAHASPDGLIVTTQGQERPQQDSWHRAEGVLEAYEFNGVKTVHLLVDKITTIEEPPVPYVFPNVLPP